MAFMPSSFAFAAKQFPLSAYGGEIMPARAHLLASILLLQPYFFPLTLMRPRLGLRGQDLRQVFIYFNPL